MIIVTRKKVYRKVTSDHKLGEILEKNFCTCFDDEEEELAFETFLSAKEKFVYDDIDIMYFNFQMNVEEFLSDDL